MGCHYDAYSEVCWHCEHKIISSKPICSAYPDDLNPIPLAIWNGAHDHTTHYEGDKGFLYQPSLRFPPPSKLR